MSEILKEVNNIVYSVLELEEDEISTDQIFYENEDLMFDSLKGFDILVKLEKKFQIKIEEDKLKQMVSIDKIVEIVSNVLSSPN